jgi:asparagine synthetase B (glutamine-hydrolysing)
MSIREVIVDGVPVLDDRVLKPSDPIFESLSTLEDYCGLARRLRGPFAVVVTENGITTVVTDFGALFPVYYVRDEAAGIHRISTVLDNLRPFVSGRISRRALFWNALRGGIGIDPMYDEARMVLPARVVRFSGLSMETVRYLDWTSFMQEAPISMEQAHDRMLEISTSYLRPLLRSEGTAACLLSGGTDSALVAYLLTQASSDVICLSADYSQKRYSEWDLAAATAARLQLPHERVPVGRSQHREAFLAMNTRRANSPVSHAQLTSLYQLGRHATAKGVRCLFTGDNAGPIFLEFDHFFAGFPKTTAGYMEALRKLTPAEKLARIAPRESVHPGCRALLDCFGLSASECQQWIDDTRQNDVRMFQPWTERYPFPVLMQVPGQLWACVANHNCWLPAQQSVGNGMQMLSPFLDIEMIRFGLSLPVPLVYKDGVSKWILRDVLDKRTGITLPKRASPNPARVWHAVPDFGDLFQVDGRVRSRLLGFMLRNVASAGRQYKSIMDTTALGLWLKAHRMGAVADPSGDRTPAY